MYCIVSEPKRAKRRFTPTFNLMGEVLSYVEEFPYLGHTITPDLCDDKELLKRMRNLYAIGNALVRKFSSCNLEIKRLMFKTYCSSLYCSALWCCYRVTSWRKVKVSHNDVLRNLLGVPRYHSASTLFVNYRLNNLDAVVRGNMFSLMQRLLKSTNTLVSAVTKGEVRVYSRMWHNFNIRLRGHDSMSVI